MGALLTSWLLTLITLPICDLNYESARNGLESSISESDVLIKSAMDTVLDGSLSSSAFMVRLLRPVHWFRSTNHNSLSLFLSTVAF